MVGDVAAADARRALVEARSAACRGGSAAQPPVRRVAAGPAAGIETVEYRDRRQSAIVDRLPDRADGPPRLAPRCDSCRTSPRASPAPSSPSSGASGRSPTPSSPRTPRATTPACSSRYLATDAAKEAEATAGPDRRDPPPRRDGITADDVDRASRHYAGTTRIGLQTNGSLLEEYAGNHLYGLGLDWTEKMLAAAQATTLDELRETAGRYAGAEAFATAILRGEAPAPASGDAP